MVSATASPMADRSVVPSVAVGAATPFRRRARRIAAGAVLGWIVGVALITAVATGAFGNLGVPDAAEPGRPRGLLVIGATTTVVGIAALVAYRRVVGSVGGLLHGAERIALGDYDVDVAVRGPRELRVLTTTFNEMAARLAVDDERRRRFLADITHELRNPLAVLQSRIEAQLDGVHPRDDDHLASLLDETHRLARLVDDLHTLALSEAGRLVLRRESVSLASLVDDVVGRFDARAATRGVALRVDIGTDLPDVWADPARLRQVLDNLLANAIRHTPGGGSVLVQVTADSDTTVRCWVTDAGPGFREDQLGAVFDRFTTAGDARGSGLGLSIARDLVSAHDGTIDAGNDPTTGGASVGFALPASIGETRRSSRRQQEAV